MTDPAPHAPHMDATTAQALVAFAEDTTAALSGLEAKLASHRLEGRYGELLSAIQWSLDQRRTDEALRLATALATFWRVSRRLSEGLDSCERVLQSAGGDEVRRGRLGYEAGMLAFWMGNDDRASTLMQQGLEIGRRAADPTLTALALCGLARIALRTDVAKARRLCRDALDVTEGTADRAGRSSAIHVLGVAAQMAGDLEQARTFMTERIALTRAMGNYAGVSMESSNLSMVERRLGNLGQAERLAREALEIFVRREDHWAVPFALNGLAAVARDRGEFARAATLLAAADHLLHDQGAAWPPDERKHYDQTSATTQEALAPADFERAMASGRAMSAAQAVVFALEGKVASERAG